jgi:glycerol-3-phosphate dehydrogenase
MRFRADALQAVEDKAFDLCVIGGGATGAGCALDAQLRGIKTALLEAGDFAGATSSASTKMVHGGVRYLEQAIAHLDLRQYRLVRHALIERRWMMQNAPFLTRPMRFLTPCLTVRDVIYYGVGLKIYDRIAGNDGFQPSCFLSRDESLSRIPALRGDLRGTLAYTDGQFDDARYCLTLLETFTACGGEALNYARVLGFERDRAGKLTEAHVEDQLSHRRFTVRARVFVNATGPFADAVRQLANPDLPSRMRPSRGVHLLLARPDFAQDALLVPRTDDGRVIFAIPWLGRLLVGTTDDPAEPNGVGPVTAHEVEYLLRHVNRYLRAPLCKDQVVSAFAGLRPLIGNPEGSDTKGLVRDHEVEVDPQSGLISILGGKWTTYRAMAEQTVDAVQQGLGVPRTPCQTSNHPLAGSADYTPDFWEKLAAGYSLAPETARHLAGKFGTASTAVLELCRRSPELALPLAEGFGALQAEVVYSVRHEMAVSLEDVLARRIGLQWYGWKEAVAAAPTAASLMARELGWQDSEKRAAVESYTARISQMIAAAGLAPAEARREKGAADSRGPAWP